MNREEISIFLDKAVDDFGLVVHEFRVKNALTLSDLADVIGVSASYILRIEQHKRNPTMEIRMRFFEQAMGLSPEDIYLYLSKYLSKEKESE